MVAMTMLASMLVTLAMTTLVSMGVAICRPMMEDWAMGVRSPGNIARSIAVARSIAECPRIAGMAA
jgi:hypothetical protein